MPTDSDRNPANQSVDGPGTIQSGDSLIMTELRGMRRSLSSSIDAISARVDQLSEEVHRSPAVSPSGHGHVSWVDRSKSPPPLQRRRYGDPADSEEEDESHAGAGFVELCEHDGKLVQDAFSSTVSNTERRRVRNSFPIPSIPQTRCPKLDPVFRASLPKSSEAKTADAELARVQAYILDPVGPLTHLLSNVDDENFSCGEARQCVEDALKLLGNASAQVSSIRRKRILKSLNPKMQDMAEEKELFESVAPMLFGNGFEAKMKERSESLKILAKARETSPPPKKKRFFPKSHPTGPQRGGGYSSRGSKSRWQDRKPATRK